MAERLPKILKNYWRKGELAYFEYHCDQSESSCDYPLYQHSHQIVKVLKISEMGYGRTLMERGENCMARVYRIRFSDGLEWDAFEDELLTSPRYYQKRFAPPEEPESFER